MTVEQTLSERIGRLSLEEKVGQTLVLGCRGKVPSPNARVLIERYQVGGLRLVPQQPFSGAQLLDPELLDEGRADEQLICRFPRGDDRHSPYVSLEDYAAILEGYQRMAQARPSGLPLFFSFDQEGGSAGEFKFGGMHLFPPPMGIRAAGGPDLARAVARAVARMTRAIGANLIHSPVLDVNVEPRNTEIMVRAYSDRAEQVAAYGLEAARGFIEGGLIPVAKHFPGRGDSPVDAHFEAPVIDVSRDTLWNRELLPYRRLLEADLLPVIMLAHSIFPAIDPERLATVSPRVIQGLLREELTFEGLITSDSITMKGLTKMHPAPVAAAMSLEAGADMILLRSEGRMVHNTFMKIREFVEQGRISEAELDEKVLRILRVKHGAGLFEPHAVGDIQGVLADPEISRLSALLGPRTVTVLRDERDILPLKPDTRALVIEQAIEPYFCPNDAQWHPGILWESLRRHGERLAYLEIPMMPVRPEKDPEAERKNAAELEKVREAAADYDTIILSNWYMRGKLAQSAIARALCADRSKRVVLLVNTPYPAICIPDEADCVVLQFGLYPANIHAAADVVYGKGEALAEWPIEFHPEAVHQ